MNTTTKITPLAYLRRELATSTTGFVAEWKCLTEKDKADLLLWARQELEAQ